MCVVVLYEGFSHISKKVTEVIGCLVGLQRLHDELEVLVTQASSQLHHEIFACFCSTGSHGLLKHSQQKTYNAFNFITKRAKEMHKSILVIHLI